MYKLANNRIIIKRAIEDVFEYAANLENFNLWFPGVESIKAANDLKFTEKGKRYKEVFSSFGVRKKVIIEVKECILMSKIATESEFLPVLPRMEILFSKINDEETEVIWSMFSRNTRLTWVLLLPLAKDRKSVV